MKTYIIPSNYIDEGRVVRGMFKTRYFIEAVIFAAIGLMFVLPVSVKTFTTKITLIVCVCGPLFMLGVVGIGGNPVSVAIMNALRWLEMRPVMLYDNKPRALVKAPIETMMNATVKRDEIIDFIDKWRTERQVQRLKQQFVEGETFKFNSDQDRMREYVDDQEDKEYVLNTKDFKFTISQEEFAEQFEMSTFSIEDEDEPSHDNVYLEGLRDKDELDVHTISHLSLFEFEDTPPVVSINSKQIDANVIAGDE